MSDNELRELISKDPFNGEYAYEICRKCHNFKANDAGHYKTARIVDRCRVCFEISEDLEIK